MVHFARRQGVNNVLFGLNDNCVTSARDQLFYRGVGQPQRGGMLDALVDLTTQGDFARNITSNRQVRTIMGEFLAWNEQPAQRLQTIAGYLGVQANDPNLPNLIQSLERTFPRISSGQRGIGYFDSRLAAAVFYQLQITDHLPVWLVFNA